MRSVNLEKWRGKRDPVALDPAGIEFKAITGRRGCAGCMFEGQWSSTCKKAASEALRRSLPDCDTGAVYVAVVRDLRQIDMLMQKTLASV